MPVSIVKICRSNRAFVNERYVYESGFPCKPRLIEIRPPRTLVLAKVDGIPYLDAEIITDEMVIKLARAIGKLHSLVIVDEKVLCHWDNQPRNILWDEKKKKINLNHGETQITQEMKRETEKEKIAHSHTFYSLFFF